MSKTGALISPQQHRNNVELSRKFDVPFDFLTDQGSKVAKVLGLNQDHGLPNQKHISKY